MIGDTIIGAFIVRMRENCALFELVFLSTLVINATLLAICFAPVLRSLACYRYLKCRLFTVLGRRP